MQRFNLMVHAEDYMLPCLSKQFLGFDCPGCGLQRSVMFLLQGDFVAAFKMYPAIYAILLLFGFLLADRLVSLRHSNKITIFLMLASLALILGNYILKFI
ncbi:DUF2752 domain-containing protein [Pricia sp. S334]|uniref:DUF2752 domain-containing protein n=1 Tax=Pricia mediterranea TaxID=3076079 RepID=A0ABU3L869_9FLAO|nr:DUF2752 domain-containing protein [Pricia sp. S334]MDT7829940.1 DUF2752 domain-containing protein [Pricia sp. S334]